MSYKALVFFRDGQDDNRAYRPGDTFPRAGLAVSAARLAELSGSANRRGIPLIREEKAAKAPEKAPEKTPEKEPEKAPEKAPEAAPKKPRKKTAKTAKAE